MVHDNAYIYKLTLNKDTESFKKGTMYVGQSIGRNTDYFSGGVLPTRLIKKYGKEVFTKEIIVSGAFNELLLNELEKHYIQLYATAFVGLNIQAGGKTQGGAPNKIVSQFDLLGNKIGMYPSIYDASLSSGVHKDSIKLAAQGKCERGGNYMWRYGNISEVASYSYPALTKVYQYGPDLKFIAEYKSTRDAAKAVGCKYTSIGNAARPSIRSNVTAVGFYWSYIKYDVLENPKIKGAPNRKIVEITDITGDIKYFKSITAASKFVNTTVAYLSKCIHYKGGLYNGFRCKFVV